MNDLYGNDNATHCGVDGINLFPEVGIRQAHARQAHANLGLYEITALP